MEKALLNLYSQRKNDIKDRLKNFQKLSEEDKFNELIFCMLTPQSNAKKCWEAVKQIIVLKSWNTNNISQILKKHTRFHNNKTRYILESKDTWKKIREKLSEEDKISLRNYICDNVKGYGLKEAGHFLRNVGLSNNEIAILDRHILRNLKALGVIEDEKIKNYKNYLEIEQKFLSYSKKINIPIDELDLLFWSKENGEIFK